MSRQVVLVVEDDAADREMYGKLLWYNGFDVIFADDGRQGLRLARENRPDIVLLDLMMPGLDGFGLCSLLKKDRRTSRIPIIALSGLPRSEVEERVREAGCRCYLEKPISPVEVLHEIEEVVGRAPPATPEADEEGQGEDAAVSGVAAD